MRLFCAAVIVRYEERYRFITERLSNRTCGGGAENVLALDNITEKQCDKCVAWGVDEAICVADRMATYEQTNGNAAMRVVAGEKAGAAFKLI
jgi:hypothetical protein